MQLLPKNEKFYELLEQLSGHVVTAVDQLNDLARGYPNIDAAVQRIEREEQSADDLTHSELEQLDKAFITPLDREDILHLMTDLYSVVAMVNALAQRLKYYRLKSLDPEFTAQVNALKEVVGCLNEIVLQLRKGHQLSELNGKLQELHHLTRDAKANLHGFLAKVFTGDPLEALKSKDLHDLMERAIDNCNTVSRTLQQVVLKNN
jgi:uncharacterized protein Yka (UPF0111/DUF47 family)